MKNYFLKRKYIEIKYKNKNKMFLIYLVRSAKLGKQFRIACPQYNKIKYNNNDCDVKFNNSLCEMDRNPS